MNEYNKQLWMKSEEKKKELDIVSVLNDKNLKKSDKASMIGFKKMRVYIDDKPISAYVNGDELFVSLVDLISTRKKFPLGFDFYYWGNECWKMNFKY